MSKHGLILVPGIMGSSLAFDRNSGETVEIWSENLWISLSSICDNPGLFKYDRETQLRSDRVLRSFAAPFKLYEVDVYSSFYDALDQLDQYRLVEFAYDWRRGVTHASTALQEFCDSLREQGGIEHFSFVGHSLGGLVISTALMRSAHLSDVTKSVCTIGTPYGGSPSAFRGLFSTGYLPLMPIIDILINFRRDRSRCKQAFLDAAQSFQSLYDLLPPEHHPIVNFDGKKSVSPLGNECAAYVPNRGAVSEATKLHRQLSDFDDFKKWHTEIAFLHILDQGLSTDATYAARIASYGAGFERIKQTGWVFGDRTVPAASAEANFAGCELVRYAGAQHMTMCSDARVIDRVLAFFNS